MERRHLSLGVNTPAVSCRALALLWGVQALLVTLGYIGSRNIGAIGSSLLTQDQGWIESLDIQLQVAH